MASGRNFVFSAKEQVWLVICVGNRAQYRFRTGIQDQRRGMGQEKFERFRFKERSNLNVKITVYHIMSEYACLV